MKIWQFIFILFLIIVASFNPKIQLHKIFFSQFKVYTDDRNGKIYWFDILTFIVIPLIISLFMGCQLSISLVSKYSDDVITIFSLVSTILLSFIAILSDKEYSNQKKREIVKETIVTITVNVVYSMLVVLLVVLPKIVMFNDALKRILFIIIIFLIIKIALNMLMILKRVSKILEF